MLETYEKKWDSKKGLFKKLNVFQKDKISGAAKAIASLYREGEGM